jgi:hypothetical protein
MAYWIDYAADVLRNAGVEVIEVDGWKRRSRRQNSSPYPRVESIFWHHTASGPLANGWPDVNWMTFNSDVRPVANAYVDRQGRWWLMAAGATNTEGVGGPLKVGSFTIAKDNANASAWSVEVANNGQGEPYPQAQVDSLIKGTAVMFHWLSHQFMWINDGLGSINRLSTHYLWTTRKIDIAGPAQYARVDDPRYNRWDMPKARVDVLLKGVELFAPKVPEPSPEPPPPTPPPSGVVSLDYGVYYLKDREWTWSVSVAVYGDGNKNPIISAANVGKPWAEGTLLTIPGKKGRQTAVLAGEGALAVIRRLFPGEQPFNRLETFYKWNGGEHRVLRQGDLVFYPSN